MCKLKRWVLTLGVMAAAPGVTLAGPFDFLKNSDEPNPAASDASRTSNNQQVAEAIANVLRQAQLSGTDIEITFQKGVATISGKVFEPGQKSKTTYLVSRVPGVEKVENRLEVVAAGDAAPTVNPFDPASTPQLAAVHPASFEANPFQPVRGIQPIEHVQPQDQAPAPAPPEESPAAPNNQQKAEQIAKALKRARLTGYDIEISFRGDTATLAGTVRDAGQRNMAEKAASTVEGVEHVNNRLVVRPETPPAWMPPQGPQGMLPVAYQPPGQPMPMDMASAAGGAGPVPMPHYSQPGPAAAHTMYNMPYMPEYAWPATAQYPNSAAVSYPTQYSASAWPYIGPFYPYPQVPLGWRQAQLEWDDGHWALRFNPRTDRWWWFMNPKNW